MGNFRAKSVVDYYVLCNKLKNIIRTGWKKWNVNRERLESIAEHIFGVQSLAIAMASQYEYDIDLYKVIFMLSVHELEEILIGDLTEWDVSKEDKMNQGHQAVSMILGDLLSGKQIEQLILEFDARETKEALFAYHCDKLECVIQCKIYDEENCVDLDNQEGNNIYNTEIIQELLAKEKGWSSMWIEYDRSKFTKDANFEEILDYIKHNQISIKKKTR